MNRSLLIGHSFRIAKVYGQTPIGVRAMCRMQRAVGGRSILELMLPRIEHLRPFDNVHGVKARVRRNFSAFERERREIDARTERGERFDMFMRRQA